MGSGFITASSSSFAANTHAYSSTGVKTDFSANGNFYGPNANEIGGAFTLTQSSGTTILGAGAGALVGKQ